jgi:hypothetical protein
MEFGGTMSRTCPETQATIYHCLGLDPKQVMHDQLNRPLPLSTGKVITQLF